MNQPINVLFIEDNPGDARLVKEELRSVNSKTIIRLDWVDRLETGIEHLATNNIQAVLLDLSLPDSQGLDTLQRVLAYVPQIPVIVMTGLSDEEVGTKAVQAGAQDYLIKGQVDGRLLTRVIQYAIQRKQSEIELADALEFTGRILTSSPIGILTFRFSGECTSANVYAAQMVGTTVEELKSQNFQELESWKQSGLYELALNAIHGRGMSAGDIHVTSTFGKESWFKSQFVTFKSAGEDLLLLAIADITERKRVEETLRTRQAMLDKTQEISHVGSWELDLKSNLLTWSDEVYRIFGVDRQEFQSTYEAFLDLIHPEDRALVDEAYSRSVKNGSDTYEIEHRIVCRDCGDVRFVHEKCEHIRDATGQIIRSVGMVQDITESKFAAAALEASEKRFRTWIENSSDLVSVIDFSGTMLYESPSVERLIGYKPEELLGKNAFALLHPDDQSKIREIFENRVKVSGLSASSEYRLRHRDGSWRWFEAIGRTYIDEHGETVALINSRDITERKQAQEAVAAMQKRFQALVENAPDGIALLGLDGRLRQLTPSSENILGYTLEDTEGQDPALLTHPDDLPALLTLLNDLIQNPGKVVSTQYRFKHKDGSWRWLESTISNLVAEPSVQAIVFNYRDITARNKLEHDIQERMKELRCLYQIQKDIQNVDITLDELCERIQSHIVKGMQYPELTAVKIQIGDKQYCSKQYSVDLDHGLHAQIKQQGNPVGVLSVYYSKEEPFILPEELNMLESIARSLGKWMSQRQAEKQISYQANLLANVNDAIIASDENDLLTAWNTAAEAMYGWKAEEVVGRRELDLIQTEWTQTTADEMRRIITETGGWRGEATQVRKDGTRMPVEMSCMLLRDESKQVRGFVSVNRDITERKKAEEKIILQANLLNAVGSAVVAIDLDGRIIYWNPAAEKLYGWSSVEALGESAERLIPFQQSPEQAQEIWNHLSVGESWSGEFMVQRKDGSVFPAFVADSPLLDANGKLIGFIGVSNDITELKRAEQARRDTEILYQTVMEKSLEAIYLYEPDTKCLVATNPAFRAILGYTTDEISQLKLYDIVAHDRSSIDRYLQQVLAEGATALGERIWRRKDGTLVSMEVTANQIHQSGRNLIFVVGRDITERKRTEEALHEKERLLSDAQRIGHIGSWSYQIASDVIVFSDEMYRLFDVLPENFRHNSKDFLALIYPSDRPAAAQWMEDMKAGVQARELNFRIFRSTGELRYLQCTGAVNFDSNGKPARFIGTTQDVTDRKVAELQINQQVKRLTALGEIDRVIMSSLDQHYTLSFILSHVIAQLQVDAADVLLLDPETQTLYFAAGQGFRTKIVETSRVGVGESYAGRAAKERRMVRVPDLRERANDPLFETLVSGEDFVSYLSLPLIIKGNVNGVLEVYQRSLLQPYQEWLDFFNTLAGQTAIAVENSTLFGSLQATNDELFKAYDATIEGWSRAMDLRDRETEGHTQRVTKLSMELAKAMGMNQSQLIQVRRGALLHDIGKLGVPDHILFKSEELDAEERKIMERHPQFAYDMLSPIEYLRPALNIPYFHHEKWDGTGYPLGLKGEQIPLEARIFAVVDVWDALLSDRPYRKAWSKEQTLDYICDQAGIHFDPQVVQQFLKIVDKN